MIAETYLSKVADGIEYLIALASIIGLLGLLIGLCMIFGENRRSGIRLIIISLVIVAIAGISTGVSYFHLN